MFSATLPGLSGGERPKLSVGALIALGAAASTADGPLPIADLAVAAIAALAGGAYVGAKVAAELRDFLSWAKGYWKGLSPRDWDDLMNENSISGARPCPPALKSKSRRRARRPTLLL